MSKPGKQKNSSKKSPKTWVALILVILVYVILLGKEFLGGGGDSSSAFVQATPAPTPVSAKLPEAEKTDYELALERAEVNATKDAPQLQDPKLWKKNTEELIKKLTETSPYAQWGVSFKVQQGMPYLIAVNRAASTITVFAEGEDGLYSEPYMAMVCSGGPSTPIGWYSTPIKYDWRLLTGPCYGQYATRIWDSYLFHSVPYYTQHKDDLEYAQFNQLGTPVSLGCIRIAVVDVKWIYDNCPLGAPVIIYNDEENPGPMGKPGTIFSDPEDIELRGWDPTDPDPSNPWPEVFRSGTAIRSEAAQEDWETSQRQGTWDHSINPTVLQGWSHDAKTEGTRG